MYHHFPKIEVEWNEDKQKFYHMFVCPQYVFLAFCGVVLISISVMAPKSHAHGTAVLARIS